MIEVFYTRFTEMLPAKNYQQLLAQLSADMQLQVSNFRKWEDAHRSLLGKALLVQGLKQFDLPSLSLAEVNYTPFQKPYFNNGIHFNISHSGEYIVCAISTIEVGIDIEEVKDIPLSDFTELFSSEELKLIFEDPTNYAPFYTLWTQKEAFLKALGVGLNMPLNKVIIKSDAIHHNGITWYLQKISIDDSYICHLASPHPNAQVNLNKLHF